jgi:hypothetical protein
VILIGPDGRNLLDETARTQRGSVRHSAECCFFTECGEDVTCAARALACPAEVFQPLFWLSPDETLGAGNLCPPSAIYAAPRQPRRRPGRRVSEAQPRAMVAREAMIAHPRRCRIVPVPTIRAIIIARPVPLPGRGRLA